MSNLDRNLNSEDGDINLKGIKLAIKLIFKLSTSNNRRKTLTEWLFSLMFVVTIFTYFLEAFGTLLGTIKYIIFLFITIIFKLQVGKDDRLKGYWRYILWYYIAISLVNIIFVIVFYIIYLLQ
jgi:hypothetical protein